MLINTHTYAHTHTCTHTHTHTRNAHSLTCTHKTPHQQETFEVPSVAKIDCYHSNGRLHTHTCTYTFTEREKHTHTHWHTHIHTQTHTIIFTHARLHKYYMGKKDFRIAFRRRCTQIECYYSNGRLPPEVLLFYSFILIVHITLLYYWYIPL